MWEAVGKVSTGLTLVAFIVSVGLYAFRASLKGRIDILKQIPEKDRLELIEKELNTFRIDASRMTPQQQYQLAMEQLGLRTKKIYLATFAVLFIAGISGGIAAYALVVSPANSSSTTDTTPKVLGTSAGQAPSASGPTSSAPGQPSTSPSLRQDGKPYRNATQEAQFLLKELGYNIQYPDGFEGPVTTLALEQFQRSVGLPLSGAADEQTLNLLRQRAKKGVFRRDPSG